MHTLHAHFLCTSFIFNTRYYCGRLLTWCDGLGNSLLARPLDTCVYRAPTDNDRGGTALSYAARWLAYGLNDLHIEGEEVGESKEVAIDHQERQFDGSYVIKTRWTLVPSSKNKNIIPCRIICGATYTFLPSGGIHVDHWFFPPSYLPTLPRAGIRFAIPSKFEHVKWLGLGPHEAYDDRKFSTYLSTFELSVMDLHTPYIYPQECGRRADPR